MLYNALVEKWLDGHTRIGPDSKIFIIDSNINERNSEFVVFHRKYPRDVVIDNENVSIIEVIPLSSFVAWIDPFYWNTSTFDSNKMNAMDWRYFTKTEILSRVPLDIISVI